MTATPSSTRETANGATPTHTSGAPLTSTPTNGAPKMGATTQAGAPITEALGLREFHPFSAAGEHFLYMVPSAGVFHVDEPSYEVLQALDGVGLTPNEITAALADRHQADVVEQAIVELITIRAIGAVAAPLKRALPVLPTENFPLQTMVLNVTNKCNLACTYCYEYGEDKIVDTDFGAKPKFMDEATARESVDFMFREAGSNPISNLTFFGGETLLNFKVLKKTLAYALERGNILGKKVRFSLTTNATLLRPEVIEWLVDNEVGVTISIDGPKGSQDQFRVFKNGMGSYEVVLPKIKELLTRHKSRPIGARVTLTKQNLNVKKIYRHLTDEVGFWTVGFAPVTTADGRDYAIEGDEYAAMLAQFDELAEEFKEAALENRHHGFSNLNETLQEIHKGMSKAFPCGAGLGLVGVATDGDVALCHRFAGSDEHKIGSVQDGIDREQQARFLETHHIGHKTDCHTCWARPLCAGGCYHEAHTRYGTTTQPNLHYCDWIRSWTDTCLRIYGEIATHNPDFLRQYDHDASTAAPTTAPVPA